MLRKSTLDTRFSISSEAELVPGGRNGMIGDDDTNGSAILIIIKLGLLLLAIKTRESLLTQSNRRSRQYVATSQHIPCRLVR